MKKCEMICKKCGLRHFCIETDKCILCGGNIG